jgi:hypothetical protein
VSPPSSPQAKYLHKCHNNNIGMRVERPPQPKGSLKAERNRLSLASVIDLLNGGVYEADRDRNVTVLITSSPMQGKGEAGGEVLARCNCGRCWMACIEKRHESVFSLDPASTSPRSCLGRSATRLLIDTEVACFG